MVDFSKFSPTIAQIAGPWFRIHQTLRGPIFFGRSGTNRWDAPDKSYGVMYAGETWQAAFMESVLHEPSKKRVLESELEKRSISLVKTSTALRLVDLSDGTVLRGLELTESDTKAFPYAAPQGISKAIYTAGWNIHGIRYASRLEPRLTCLALFDFPEDLIYVHDLDLLLASGNQGLVSSILNQYQIHLIKDL